MPFVIAKHGRYFKGLTDYQGNIIYSEEISETEFNKYIK